MMRAAMLAWLGCALLPAFAAEDSSAPRDAAQVVQEGDVERWLEHYQRERGAEWTRQPRTVESKPAAQEAGAPPVGAPTR